MGIDHGENRSHPEFQDATPLERVELIAKALFGTDDVHRWMSYISIPKSPSNILEFEQRCSEVGLNLRGGITEDDLSESDKLGDASEKPDIFHRAYFRVETIEEPTMYNVFLDKETRSPALIRVGEKINVGHLLMPPFHQVYLANEIDKERWIRLMSKMWPIQKRGKANGLKSPNELDQDERELFRSILSEIREIEKRGENAYAITNSPVKSERISPMQEAKARALRILDQGNYKEAIMSMLSSLVQILPSEVAYTAYTFAMALMDDPGLNKEKVKDFISGFTDIDTRNSRP